MISSLSLCCLLFSLIRPRPRSTLFPYTTLFRSRRGSGLVDQHRIVQLRRRQHARHCPADAQPFDEGTGVDSFQAQDTVLGQDRKSTRLNSSHPSISYAVFCLKKKKKQMTYLDSP